MQVLAVDKIYGFIKRCIPPHVAQKAFSYWLDIVRAKKWDNTIQVKEDFATASFVNGQIVFDVGGNKYRVVCRIQFEAKTVMITFAGTHKEYDKLELTKTKKPTKTKPTKTKKKK